MIFDGGLMFVSIRPFLINYWDGEGSSTLVFNALNGSVLAKDITWSHFVAATNKLGNSYLFRGNSGYYLDYMTNLGNIVKGIVPGESGRMSYDPGSHDLIRWSKGFEMIVWKFGGNYVWLSTDNLATRQPIADVTIFGGDYALYGGSIYVVIGSELYRLSAPYYNVWEYLAGVTATGEQISVFDDENIAVYGDECLSIYQYGELFDFYSANIGAIKAAEYDASGCCYAVTQRVGTVEIHKFDETMVRSLFYSTPGEFGVGNRLFMSGDYLILILTNRIEIINKRLAQLHKSIPCPLRIGGSPGTFTSAKIMEL
jgi:hypothetical protein